MRIYDASCYATPDRKFRAKYIVSGTEQEGTIEFTTKLLTSYLVRQSAINRVSAKLKVDKERVNIVEIYQVIKYPI